MGNEMNLENLHLWIYSTSVLLFGAAYLQHRRHVRKKPKHLEEILMNIADTLLDIQSKVSTPVTATLDPAVAAQISDTAANVTAIKDTLTPTTPPAPPTV